MVGPNTEDQLKIQNLETIRACRLCIICANSKEAGTVKDQLGAKTTINGYLVDQIAPVHNFYLGTLATSPIKFPYYITSTTRQGIQSFAAQSAALFSILKPDFVLHVGVCAAISNQGIELEDVIFGEKALNYEEGKWELVDEKPVFSPDSKTVGTDSDNMNAFLTANGRPLWKHGDYISGSAVRMDSKEIFDRVKKATLRKVMALEMEASAFFQVCEYMKIQALGVIKGVSDMGDEYKGVGNDQHYSPALRNAAKAAQEFATWSLKSTPVEKDKQKGEHLAERYYNEFVGEVVLKAFSEKLNFYIGSKPVKMQGFRIVMPAKNDVKAYKNLQIMVLAKGFHEVYISGTGKKSIPVWTKGPYFIEFPTILTDLDHRTDTDLQVENFKKTLESKVEGLGDGGFTRVISWDDFETLCTEVDHKAALPPEPASPAS